MNYLNNFGKSATLRDPVFGSLFDDFFTTTNKPKATYHSRYNTKVDILESDNDYKVVANLPGFSKENVSIDIQEGVLTLKAAKQEEDTADESYRALRQERVNSNVERRFYLDDSVDAENVTATLENGVLELRLPKLKAQEPAVRSVTIN